MRIVPSEDTGAEPLSDQSHEHLAAELKELRATLDMLGQRFATHTVHVSSENVHSRIRARAVRLQLFEEGLFADPAWDMLLDLMAARLDRQRVAVSSLCIAAAVPPTTALRWIKTLTDHGLFVRTADPQDGRRVFIELSDKAAAQLSAYLRAVQRISPHSI